MNAWATRLKSRMKELKITHAILAEKMGLTRGSVTHYLSGRRVPPLNQFEKLAAILKVDPAWLQYGIDKTADNTQLHHEKIIAKKESIEKPIPILSWEQAAEFTDITKMDKDGINEWVPNFYTDQSQLYALRIKGDAMTANVSFAKSFYEGDVIIVDPAKLAKHGSYVIALLPRTKEVTFKQFVIDGGVRYLKPLNPQYPLVKIDDSTHVCGVVVLCLTKFL